MAVSLMRVVSVLNGSLITPTNGLPSLEQPVNHISLFGACGNRVARVGKCFHQTPKQRERLIQLQSGFGHVHVESERYML